MKAAPLEAGEPSPRRAELWRLPVVNIWRSLASGFGNQITCPIHANVKRRGISSPFLLLVLGNGFSLFAAICFFSLLPHLVTLAGLLSVSFDGFRMADLP